MVTSERKCLLLKTDVNSVGDHQAFLEQPHEVLFAVLVVSVCSLYVVCFFMF